MPSPSQAIVEPKRIAIACQGGGSHTAFTAGVLQVLLRRIDPAHHRCIALSGTSGGALCAALAWYGMLTGNVEDGAQRLEAFWQEMAAREVTDALGNQLLVWLQRNASLLPTPEISPYLLPTSGQNYLETLIRRHLDFAALPRLVSSASPRLLVGAVEVHTGDFTVFHSHHREPGLRITPQALLASAAIPELFRAVRVGKGLYWDGLFSQNPPVRGFLAGDIKRDAKPDEIWVIRINPRQRHDEPRSSHDITDRRNELAGNLSLAQELFFIEQTNRWLAKGMLPAEHFKPVTVREIPLALELDYPSKLDRQPAFIDRLLNEGRRAAGDFLAGIDAA